MAFSGKQTISTSFKAFRIWIRCVVAHRGSIFCGKSTAAMASATAALRSLESVSGVGHVFNNATVESCCLLGFFCRPGAGGFSVFVLWVAGRTWLTSVWAGFAYFFRLQSEICLDNFLAMAGTDKADKAQSWNESNRAASLECLENMNTQHPEACLMCLNLS